MPAPLGPTSKTTRPGSRPAMPLSSNDGSSAKIILTNTGKVTQPERALDPRSVPIGQAGGPRKMQRDRPQRGWQANASRRRASSNAPIGRRADRSSKDGCRANASAARCRRRAAHDLGRAREHAMPARCTPRRSTSANQRQPRGCQPMVGADLRTSLAGAGSTAGRRLLLGQCRRVPASGERNCPRRLAGCAPAASGAARAVGGNALPERAATSRGHAISCRRRH